MLRFGETKVEKFYATKKLLKMLRLIIMPEMKEYVNAFKVKNGDKDKHNKLMSFHIVDEKLLQKYKGIWTKIEDIKNIKLNAITVYDER